MIDQPRKATSPRSILRAVWKDGFAAAWLVVSGLVLLVSLTAPPQWLLGAGFGIQVGMVGGYFVTQHRNYRRTSRENLEWELSRMKQLRLRAIARPPHPAVGRDDLLAHLDESERQLHESIKALS